MFELLLGHLVGDYLFQTRWMALNKTKYNLEGWLSAFIHCLIYTICVCLIMWNFDWYWILIVFFSHFILDKFGLSEKYVHYVKQNGLKEYVQKDFKMDQYNIIDGGFRAFVYAVTDNTLHLLIMWLCYIIIY